MLSLFAWLYWNPDRVVFTVPVIDRPVVWYGLWFVSGLIASYLLLIPMFKQKLQTTYGEAFKGQAIPLLDRLTWFMIGGILIGARLGHVFFYEWARYQDNWMEIPKIWKGGLASHGAAVGILSALYFYQRSIRRQYPAFSFITLLDMIVIPAAFTGVCIRIGNFFNQEILGIPSQMPWAVVFGDPADGSAPQPLHPVQLYEAGAYLITFIFLYALWRIKGSKLPSGLLSGLFFILLFSSRFLIEFLKTHQSTVIDESFLQMGQYLSVPFIVAGIFLCFYGRIKHYCMGVF